MPNPVLPKGFQPTAAITQFKLVKQASTTTVTQTSASTDRVLGVCQEEVTTADATAGRVVNIMTEGISRVICGGTGCTVGVRVMSDTSGRAVVAATTGNIPCGVVVAAGTSTAAGDHIDILLTPGLPAIP